MFYNGKSIKLDIYGESHAPFIGVKIYGIKKGESIDFNALKEFTDRRKSKNSTDTQRKEDDVAEFISGISQDGITDGKTVEVRIKNKDYKPEDYEKFKSVPRPSTADFPAKVKYKDNYGTGSGPFSGRMTAPLCVAGGIAIQILKKYGIEIKSHILSVGKITGTPLNPVTGEIKDDEKFLNKALKAVEKAVKSGDSLGGVIECAVTGLPIGLGGAMFDGLESEISQTVFAIPAVKGIEFGSGFSGSKLKGSENNDNFIVKEGKVQTESNNAGGILGGMSSGMPLTLCVAFKPTPSIEKTQKSVDLNTMKEVSVSVSARRDGCIVLRACPIVESAVAIALLSVFYAENVDSSLTGLREKIDLIDDEIASLLNKRLHTVIAIGEYKVKNGIPVKDAGREKEITERLKDNHPEIEGLIPAVYDEVFKYSKKMEKKLK